MAITTTQSIIRYTVQTLTKKVGENARTTIIVRLYDDDSNNRGVILFENYGDEEPPKPTGDFDAQTVTAYLDIAHYAPYMDILRLEKPIYLKMAWTQFGASKRLSQVSIDTKKEILGEFFDQDHA